MEPPREQLPDLVELLATDLDRYFPQLVLSTQQRLYAFASRQTGSPQDAEDIVQEAFIRAYHALRTSITAIAADQGISASKLKALEMDALASILNRATKAGNITSQAASNWRIQLQNNSNLREKIVLALLDTAPTS